MLKNCGIYDILYCSNLNFKERINIYKQVGFSNFAMYFDNDYMQDNENYLDVFNYAKSVNMTVEQVHLDYKNVNLMFDDSTNFYFNYLNNKAKECSKLGIKYMVIHPSRGETPPKISVNQLKKLKNIALQNKNVSFCFENVSSNLNLESILNLNIQNIKMCYDLGHAHAYDNELKLFKKLKDKIVCTHLHNNFGSDDHLLLTDGEINYKPIIEEIKKIQDCSNCLECFPKKNTTLTKNEFFKFVEKCYLSLKNI